MFELKSFQTIEEAFEQFRDLVEYVNKLEAENLALKKENAELKAEIGELKAEIQRLKDDDPDPKHSKWYDPTIQKEERQGR